MIYRPAVIVVPVTVIRQPRLLIVSLPWQTVRLVQVMRVFLIQQVSHHHTPRSRSIAVFADERQRQAPVVAVVKMTFSRRCVFRLHLSGQLLHRQPALRKPRPAFTAHAVCPDLFLQLSSSRTSSAGNTTPCPSSLPSCCIFSARLRRWPSARRSRLDPDERREASRSYTVWIRVVSVCTVVSLSPSHPYHVSSGLRDSDIHPVRYAATPHPFRHSPSQRVVEVAALSQWLAMLYPRETPAGAGCRSDSGGCARRASG